MRTEAKEGHEEMKVTMVSTGKTVELNDSYALRMIEQGRATPAYPARKKGGKKEGTAKSGTG